MRGSRDAVASLLRQGKHQAAAHLAEELLQSDPTNDDLFGLLAVARERLGDAEGTGHAYQAALVHARDEAHRIRYAGNYAAYLIECDRKDDARAVVRKAWIWSPETGAAPSFVNAAFNLARVLHALDLADDALALARQVEQRGQMNFGFFRFFIRILCECGRTEEADASVKAAPGDLRNHDEFVTLRAYVAGKSGRGAEAWQAIETSLRMYPVHLGARPHDGAINVVVINDVPTAESMIEEPVHRHFALNFPRQLLDRMSKHVVFDSVFASCGQNDLVRVPRDRPSLCLNNVTNGEQLIRSGSYSLVQSMETSLGLPVINSAEKAMACTRIANAKTFGALVGLVVPKIATYRKVAGQGATLARTIEQAFSYPMIVRNMFSQMGQNVFHVASREDLVTAIDTIVGNEIYVIEFVDKPKSRPHFRRMRAVFVGHDPVIVRADYSPFWMIHGRVMNTKVINTAYSMDLYRDRPDLLADADEIMRRPEERLGLSAMNTLRAIARLCPLDLFGLDFDIDDFGNVVFFEANAHMNFYLSNESEFPYPREPFEALDALFLAYFKKQVEGGPASLAIGQGYNAAALQ